MRRVLLAIGCILLSSAPANAACTVGKLLELKVTMQGTRPLADVGINGRTLPFLVDSGAFFSTISPGTAQELGLRLEDSAIQLRGIGGAAGRTSVTRVKSIELAGIPLHNIDFIVGGGEIGAAGLLGQNVLGIGDVEYDLGHGAIRVMRPKDCSSETNLAYWSGSAPVSELRIEPREPLHPHTIGTVILNGAKIRAIFDSGAGSSIISLRAAKRAGLTPSSPGVQSSGLVRGLGRSMVRSWLAPVDSIKIGDEEIRRIKLHIGELDLNDTDMLVGADFFLSHRIYVSNQLHKMYFTYDGGPVFNISPSRVVDEAGLAQPMAGVASPTPTDADGLSRRGAVETSRRDLKAALADLDRAVALAPDNARYLFERSRARMLDGDRSGALADLDAAARLAPGDPEIGLTRAESLLARQRRGDALAEMDAIDAALPKEADQRLVLAALFERTDQFDKAIGDYDRWIAAHPDDSRQPAALNGRCWTRALAGRDLPLALKDCDSAIRRVKSSAYYDSRGLVELRLGQYDRAVSDYDESLQSRPQTAWSLYGRGLAKVHKHDPSAQADIAAALAIDPRLDRRAKELGID